MNILILGPQGSGKGTQSRLLVSKFGLVYFESGDFLRDLATNNEVVRKTMTDGLLVPDAELSSYVAAYLDEKECYDNILFDGFPRSLDQYSVFKPWLQKRNVSIDIVFVLTINEDETIKRLSARRQDPETSKIYNMVTDPPPAGVDQDKLIQREDDKPEAIKKRLDLYKDRTLPLIAELRNETRVIEVNGERSIDEIQNELIKNIEEHKSE